MISVIIPALNEESALLATLKSLLSQEGVFEVILVDGGSTDRTLAIAGQFPSVHLLTSPPGRGVQMNAGAAAARGELLLFLHADTLLPTGALAKLAQMNLSSDSWGGFHQSFSGAARPLRFVSAVHNLRCRVTRVFYGDQAMFVRRAVFAEAGGFPEEPILEDIRLSEQLKARSRPVFMDDYVITDSRKFEQMGPWRGLAHCLLILICYELRLPILGQRFFAAFR